MTIAITDIRTRTATTGNLALAPEPAAPQRPRIQAVPEGTEARGFVLYVGLGEGGQNADGVDLATLVTELRKLTARLTPSAQTHASVAIAPAGAGGRDIDVVRRAFRDPAIRQPEAVEEPAEGVTIDLSRGRVTIGDDVAALTYKEFELLQCIVLRAGRTVERSEIIDTVWADATGDEVPGDRTIDVHVRRLRSKLGAYADIVRTVRGAGYRFDAHADVAVLSPTAASPDRF